VTENPPLAGYYLAAAAGIFGWSEIALHFAFLLPALAVILGTHRLARRFCNQPVLAALATLFTPVFLVSSLTVMCDVTMLALWVWAVVFWVEGTKQDKLWKLFVAGLLIGLAEMTKYYGACLFPLLSVYSLINRRRLGRWAAFMLVPLVVLCVYQYVTQAVYGGSLLYRAMDYASFTKGFFGFSKTDIGLTALAFTGGCLAMATMFAPLLWRPRTLAALAVGAVAIAAILHFDEAIWKKYGVLHGTARTSVEIQTVVWATGGLCVLALAVADVWRRRDADSWLPALWVLGTFIFAAFVNWVVNGRSFLPMAPAVGILIARGLEQKVFPERKAWKRGAALCLTLGAALALLVARADCLMAVAVRKSAQEVCARCKPADGTLWFQGHWGFQFYMEAGGAHPFDIKHSSLKPWDNLALPANNTILQPNLNRMISRGTLFVPGPHLLTTWSQSTGAGFYASVWGPLPFAFGRVPPEGASVYVLKR